MTGSEQADAQAHVTQILRTPDDHRLVRSLLDVAAGVQVEARSISARQLDVLDRHRVAALLPTSWSVEDGRDLDVLRRSIAVRQLRLYATLDDVVQRFGAVGIESRALKGLATSRLDYDRPAQRHTGDVDVLIRRESLQAAIDALVDIGGHGRGMGAASDPFAKGGRIDLPNGVQIDLHTRLTESGSAQCDVLFADPERIPGSEAESMPVELRLVHAASHLAYTPPGLRRLSGVADISAIRARHVVDFDRVRTFAEDLGLERLTGYALRLERAMRGLDAAEFDDWTPPTRLERWSYARPERRLLMERVLRVASIDGVGGRARYIRHCTIPSRHQLRLRGGAGAYYRRALPQRFGGQNLDGAR